MQLTNTHEISQCFNPGNSTFSRNKNFKDPFILTIDHGKSLKEIEKMIILWTLELENNNRTKTCLNLGIGIRTLQRKINIYRDQDQRTT